MSNSIYNGWRMEDVWLDNSRHLKNSVRLPFFSDRAGAGPPISGRRSWSEHARLHRPTITVIIEPRRPPIIMGQSQACRCGWHDGGFRQLPGATTLGHIHSLPRSADRDAPDPHLTQHRQDTKLNV